jgi:hypothetical protein
LALRRDQHRTGTVREQTPQIDITAFADATEVPSLPARVLTRCQPEPARKLSRTPERTDVAHGSDECRRRQQPNARNRPQPRDDGVGIGEHLQLAFELADPLLDGAHFGVNACENLTQMARQ